MGIYGIIFLSLSLSIDSIGIGLGCGISKVRVSAFSCVIICFVSCIITALSLALGNALWILFSGNILIYISNIFLIAMGMFIMIQGFIKSKDKHSTVNIMRNPDSCDIDNSKNIDLKEAIITAIALSADSIGVGVCSCVYGLDIIVVTILAFIFMYLFIMTGLALGKKSSDKFKLSPKFSVAISGIIIIGIGLYRLLT